MASKNNPVFNKYGSYYHLNITESSDMEHILKLPDSLWMATSCPVSGLRIDPDFLKALDTNGNGRIVSGEVREAVRWILKTLKPSLTWTKHESCIPLDLFRETDPEGVSLKEAARKILAASNHVDGNSITLEQVRDRTHRLSRGDHYGDGIISPELVEEKKTAGFVQDLITAFGSVSDSTGRAGINEEHLSRYKAEAKLYLEWQKQANDVMPFGPETPELYLIVTKIREKIEQFFAQCDLIRFKPSLAERLFPHDLDTAGKSFNNSEEILEFLRRAPLTQPNSEGVLNFTRVENDFYRDTLSGFQNRIMTPVLGKGTKILNKSDWDKIKLAFQTHDSWQKSKPKNSIEFMGIERIEEYLKPSYSQAIQTLISREKTVALEIELLKKLEKLILFHQWLFVFVNNFVSFPHLFRTDTRAIFEMGTLIINSREFFFSVRVDNREAHAALAKNSSLYLLYIRLFGDKSDTPFEIAVPVTKGNAKGFYIGKRGVFLTWSGKELDAQIVKIIENPISLWESMKQPFRRLISMITSRFTQMTSTLQKEAETSIAGTSATNQKLQSNLQQIKQSPLPVQSGAVQPDQALQSSASAPTKSTRDLMIGAGFLVAGVGTALKFLVDAAKQLTQPETLRILLFMIAIFLSVTMFINAITAAKKLRQRDLSVLLQASGWAINGRMRLIRSMAKFFSRKTSLPKGARKHHRELIRNLSRR